MTEVQMPPDVPAWVSTLENQYHRLVEAALSFNAEVAGVNAHCAKLPLYGLSTQTFDIDALHKNAAQFGLAVYQKLNQDLSVNGVVSNIPVTDFPNSILCEQVKDFTDPHSFSPIKLYQYLSDKYAGNFSARVYYTMAEGFTDLFGHGQWKYEYIGGENRFNPRVDNFLADSFDQRKGVTIGHIRVSAEKSWGALADHVDWNPGACDTLVEQLKTFAGLLRTIGEDRVAWFFEKVVSDSVKDCNGSKVAYGLDLRHEDGRVKAIFRKERLVVEFKEDLFRKIHEFVVENYFKNPKRKDR